MRDLTKVKKKLCSYFVNVAVFFAMVYFPHVGAAQPRVADQQITASCQYLSDVEGNSGYGKKADWKVFAQDSALKKAEKLGASHVVWDRYYPVGAFNGIAVAKVYRCNS